MDKTEILYTNTQKCLFQRWNFGEHTDEGYILFLFRFSLPCLFAYPPAYSRVVTRHVKETYKDYTCYGRINPQAESTPREWLLESWVIGPPPVPQNA